MFGTLSVLDTLRSSQQTVTQYGEANAAILVQTSLAAHNDQFNGMVRDFIERSMDSIRFYGNADQVEMQEVTEFGRSDAQKVGGGETVGFPIRKFDINKQWTKDFFDEMAASDLALQIGAAQDAHIRNLQRQVKRALFIPLGYTFQEKQTNVQLNVKPLLNGDGASVPTGPNAETFTGSHNHYLARAGVSLVAADVTGLVRTVQEHYATGMPMLYINVAEEMAIRAMTPNFSPILDARIIPGSGVTVAAGSLNTTNLYNRVIGIFDGAEVWVKPWIPAGYMFAFVKGAPVPLVMRERFAGRANLRMVADNEYHPLRTNALASEFGCGVWNRTNGAVLFADGNTYVAPTV